MNAWEPLIYLLVFGFFVYCLVRTVASIASATQNPNRPDGEAGLALFLSVLVLFLLVGVFFAPSEQQPIVAEEDAEQQVPSTTDEGTTEEAPKQPSIEPEEPPQQAPTEPEALPQDTPTETEGLPQEERPSAAPIEPEDV